MGRSPNAQLAVSLYNELLEQYHWNAASAWHGIAMLLLSCDIYREEWRVFHNVVVYRESNDFRSGPKGPNAVLRRASVLTEYLAGQLGVPRAEVCGRIGLYWRLPQISHLQPHNLLGHAFCSLVVNVLELFGDRGICYEQEVRPRDQFPGFPFPTRSDDAKLDIVGRRGSKIVALLSARWRYRHDRVDLVDEARAYAPAARSVNPACKLYAVVGEFAPSRLEKILSNCPPALPHAALSAAVHFAPQLVTEGLGEDGRMSHLKSLEWLVGETYSW